MRKILTFSEGQAAACLASVPEPLPTGNRRHVRLYDHRLRQLVSFTRNITPALACGVPRSTALGWLRGEPREVATLDVLDMSNASLQAEVLKLRRKVSLLVSICRLLLGLTRACGLDRHSRQLSEEQKATLLVAIRRARSNLTLAAILRLVGLPASRYHAWVRTSVSCEVEPSTTCVRKAPNQLTPEEVLEIRQMVTDPQYRHVPVTRLALLAQRLGRVLASTSTWYRLVRKGGWRRPRLGVHPKSPRVGLRTGRPNEAWHVDTTVLKLLDGTKVYLCQHRFRI